MAFELKEKDGSTRAARRMLRERIDGALESLQGRQPLTDGAVHQARKEIKRARAVLRLWREGLGLRAYRRENAALRDAGRPLAEVRDAKVMLDTIDALREHFGKAMNGIALNAFRRRLQHERRELRGKILRPRGPLTTARRELQASRRRIARLAPRSDAWAVYGVGLKRTYAQGRRRFREASRDRTAEALHEWRKSVKYLRHQLQVLRPVWPGLIGELADQAHKLTEYLGEDHDLCVLRQKVTQHSDTFADPAASAFAALIDRRRLELQACALALGERLYQERPREFRNRLAEYWMSWRRERAPRAGRLSLDTRIPA